MPDLALQLGVAVHHRLIQRVVLPDRLEQLPHAKKNAVGDAVALYGVMLLHFLSGQRLLLRLRPGRQLRLRAVALPLGAQHRRALTRPSHLCFSC